MRCDLTSHAISKKHKIVYENEDIVDKYNHKRKML